MKGKPKENPSYLRGGGRFHIFERHPYCFKGTPKENRNNSGGEHIPKARGCCSHSSVWRGHALGAHHCGGPCILQRAPSLTRSRRRPSKSKGISSGSLFIPTEKASRFNSSLFCCFFRHWFIEMLQFTALSHVKCTRFTPTQQSWNHRTADRGRNNFLGKSNLHDNPCGCPMCTKDCSISCWDREIPMMSHVLF